MRCLVTLYLFPSIYAAQEMAFSFSSLHKIRATDDRFARFTPDNHSAVLWIATLLSLIYAALVLVVRLGFVKRRAHGLDDVVLTLAHVCIQRLIDPIGYQDANYSAACGFRYVGIAICILEQRPRTVAQGL